MRARTSAGRSSRVRGPGPRTGPWTRSRDRSGDQVPLAQPLTAAQGLWRLLA